MRSVAHRATRFPAPGFPFPSLAAAVALVCLTSLASAQGMPSEKGSVAQTIDGTTITIEYYTSGRARGRTPFPDVGCIGAECGRLGRNWATTLDVDKPVHLNGNAISKGKFSPLWIDPGGLDEWNGRC